MRDRYVYVAQHRKHREDLMYSLVSTRLYDLANLIGSREADYIIYGFSSKGRCRIVELKADDFRHYRGGAPWDSFWRAPVE